MLFFRAPSAWPKVSMLALILGMAFWILSIVLVIMLGSRIGYWANVLPISMVAFGIFLGSIGIARLWLRADNIVLLIITIGLLSRIIYGLSTPYGVRSYDSHAHLEYVQYLTEQWSIPPASGWEFHQPPLYYASAAVIARVGKIAGWPLSKIVPWIQLLSSAIACATLLAGLWIGVQIFPHTHRRSLHVYTILLVGLPGLIMFSSRISNDPLLTLEVFLAGGLLLRWWRTKNVFDWYPLWILGGLAFLTKLNGIVIPMSIAVLAFLQTQYVKLPIRHWVIGLTVFLLMTLWLPIIRFQGQSSDIRNFIMTGKSGINHALSVEHVPADFLTFNPIEMVKKPFNKTYGNDGRRSNSLEFLFRSSLFGEFSDFSAAWLAKGIIVLALLLLPWMAYGLASIPIRFDRSDTPVIVLFLITLILWLAYIIIFQFSPEQDFRFSPFFAVAAAYFIAKGLEVGPKRYQEFGVWCAWSLSILCILILIL